MVNPNTNAQQPEPWHLKREIQITHVITTATIALSAAAYVSKMDQRIALLEQSQAAQASRDARQDSDMTEKALVLGRQLERMEAKIDRLVEREHRK